MKTRCEGCGAKIQTVNPNLKGYIKSEVYLKNPDSFLCERCYNLLHYNKKIEVEYKEAEFRQNMQKIAVSGGLIVAVADIFDLEGTIIESLNEYFPQNNILFVANKFDLFLDSVKVTRVKEYVLRFLKEKNIRVHQTLVISANSPSDILRLLEAIDRMQENRDIYLVGMTNVGKSSILNAICRYLKKEATITVSNTISTTLDFIKVPLPNKTFIIDTPGILNRKQATYYLDKENLQLLSPKKAISPKVFQIHPGQALFLGGFAVIRFLEGEKSSFVVYVSSMLTVHRTKLENENQFYQEHADDILKIPNAGEREKMGPMKNYEFSFSKEKKIDITVSGVGFVTLSGMGKVEVGYLEAIRVGIREAIL